MIVAKGLCKRYGQLDVLKGVDLTVEKGKVVSVTGASGAGKTTLLQLLGSLEPPTAGTVEIDGENPYRLSAARLARFRNRHIGFVFQFHYLLPEFSALENVMMPALIGGESARAARGRAAELLDFLGLSARAAHKPGELSGGEQQRVAVARALMNRPSVVLADEPSGNLDTAHAQALHELFFRLRDEFGQTFVIVTHNEHLA
ncbi:MAG: ABC transporter ATP-binding protein, partial [Bacteroidales bacterium]|nr:ABC transporter ATP-binding protein [Bacteroidales bacterium]